MNETKIIGSKELEDKKYGYNVEIYQLEEGKEAKKATEKVVLTNKGESKKAIGIKIKTQGVFYFSGLSEFEIRMCQEGTSEEIYQLYEIDKWEEFRIESRRYIKDIYARKEYEEEKEVYVRYINLVRNLDEPNKEYYFIIDKKIEESEEYELEIDIKKENKKIEVTREYYINNRFPKKVKYDEIILKKNTIYENMFHLKVIVENRLINYKGKELSANLKLIYDGSISDINYEYEDNYYKLPYGWSLNYQQRVIKAKEEEKYLYLNGEGQRYYFIKEKDNLYVEEKGTGYILEVEENKIKIKGRENQEYIFNKEGYLEAIYSGEKSLFITYEEKQNYGKVITRIKDSSKRQLTIEYKEKQINITRSDGQKVTIRIENGEIQQVIDIDGSKSEYRYNGKLLSRIIEGDKEYRITRASMDVTVIGKYVKGVLKNERYYENYDGSAYITKSRIEKGKEISTKDKYYFNEKGDYYKRAEVVLVGNETKYYGEEEDRRSEYTKELKYEVELIKVNVITKAIQINYEPENANITNYYEEECNKSLEAGNYIIRIEGIIPYGSSIHLATDQEIKITIWGITKEGKSKKIEEFPLDVTQIDKKQEYGKEVALEENIEKIKVEVYTYKMFSVNITKLIITQKTKTLPICFINKKIESTFIMEKINNPIVNNYYYIDRPEITIYAIRKPVAIKYKDELNHERIIEGDIDLSKEELIENIKNYNNYENTFWYNGFKRVITNYKRTSIKIKYGEDNYVSLEGLEVIDYNILNGIDNYTIYAPSNKIINNNSVKTMLVKTYANVINESDIFSDEETYIFTQIENDKYNRPLESYEYSYNRRVITRYEYDENDNLIGIKSGSKVIEGELSDLSQDIRYTYDSQNNYVIKIVNKSNNHLDDEINMTYDEMGNMLTYKPIIGNVIEYEYDQYKNRITSLRQTTEDMWLENRITYEEDLIKYVGQNRISTNYEYEYDEEERLKKIYLTNSSKKVLIEEYKIYYDTDECEFEVGKDNVGITIEYGNLQKVAYIYDKYQRLIITKEYENNEWKNIGYYIYGEEEIKKENQTEIETIYEIEDPLDSRIIIARTSLLRKKIDYITNIKEEYYYNNKKQLTKVIYKDLEGNKIKEKENIYKNDLLVRSISETEEKEYYYDQWQSIGRESIHLKEKEENHLELKICYERNEIGQLEGKIYFASRINNYEIEPSYQKLEECKEEYIYVGGGTNKLQYNNLANKKKQPFNKEEEKVTYANSGQIVEIRDKENKIKKEYEYNNLAGTLKQEYNKEMGQVITYGYEDVNNFGGNLLRKKRYNLNYELEEDIEYLYEMPYIDLLKGIKINNETKNFTYDEGLNLIQYEDKELRWKRGRLLESIEDKEKKIEYIYDSNNVRIEKKEIRKAESTKYEVEGTRIISETKIRNNEEEYRIKYIYTGEEIIGFEIKQKNIRRYYIYEKDLEHNIVGLYEMGDYYGTRVASYVYDAYGNHKVLDKNKEENKAKDFIGNINPIRYKGYYYDVETGYFWLSSRYYSPELGRFIQPADVSTLNPSSINGLNLYSYANNNPISIHYNTTLASAGIIGGGMVSSIGSSVSGGAISGSGVGGSSSPSRNLPSVPGWLGTLSTGLDHGFTMINPIRSAIACLQFTDLWDLMRLDGVTELPGALSKVATGIGWGLSIAGGVIAGYEKYASGASLSSSIAGGLINAGISIGGMYASTAIATAAMGALAASSLAIPGGVIIVGGAVIAVVAGIAINHLFTKLEIGGNTIEGHLNDFVDWLIFWD